jgi:hypothetical protein
MTALAAALASCSDPTQLMAVARVAPPSPAIATILRAAYAARPLGDDLRTWAAVSRMPWPKKKPRRVAACVGRRGLKTSGILAWSCVFEALCVDHDSQAAEGSRLHFSVVAPLVAQAKEAVLAIRAVLDQLAGLGVRYALRDAADSPEIVVLAPRARCEHVIVVETADAVSVRSTAKPWIGYDEWGFAPSGDGHAVRDVDVERAGSPAQVQFRAPTTLYVSSPGAPGSSFQRHVEKPGSGTLVVRGASWTTNARVSRAMCLAEAGDLDVLAQEYEASRFGFHNENYINATALVLGGEMTGKGPRPGSFVVAFDAAQTSDETALGVFSMYEVEVSPTHAPIKHVVAEHLETMSGSRRAPVPVEAIAARVVALSRAYNDAPALSDRFLGPVIAAELVKLGMREFWDPDGDRVPPLGHFCQRSMAPEKQTPRWRELRALVHGGRLHVPDTEAGEKLRAQLAGLRATQQPSGALKVEGRRDDYPDIAALAVPVVLKVRPTDGPGGAVEFLPGTLLFDEEGVHAHGSRWVRVLPNGRAVPVDWPEWAPGFDEWCEERAAAGELTPAVMRWLERRKSAPALNVPVEGEAYARPAQRQPAEGWGRNDWQRGWGFDPKKSDRR